MYHLTMKSANAKVGPIPVSTSTAAHCPAACPLKGSGCYADNGPLALHWRKVTAGERGTDWPTFVAAVAAFPAGQLWRHNQAGDLPGDAVTLDRTALTQLVRANRGRRGFTYTHYRPQDSHNAALIRGANRYGFTVNLSAEGLEHADELLAADCGPVVTLLPADQLTNTVTPKGRRVVVCPAVTRDNVNCASCGLCANAKRTVVVGFPVHGSGKAKAAKVIRLTVSKGG